MIIIFKHEINGRPDVAQSIGALCQETAQIGNACIYVPKAGKTDELVTLLQRQQIRFGLHQSSGQAKKEVYEN